MRYFSKRNGYSLTELVGEGESPAYRLLGHLKGIRSQRPFDPEFGQITKIYFKHSGMDQ